MGQRLRDDAQAFVQSGYPHKWSRWEEVKRLIVEHDAEDDPIPEGLEAFGYDYDLHTDSDAENDSCDEAAIDGGADGQDDARHDPGGGAAGDAASSDGSNVITVSTAREVLINHARMSRDDVTLRRLLRQRDESEKLEKDAATDAAKILQKRAMEELERVDKQRKQARRDNLNAQKDANVAAQLKAEAAERQEKIRLEMLRENLQWQREELARRQALEKWKAEQSWLQAEYPRALARKLVRAQASMKALSIKTASRPGCKT